MTTDGRLAICVAVSPNVVMDRVPMRSAELHFWNQGTEPLRLYLPRPDAFRSGISSLTLVPPAGDPIFVPEPRPHGYVVTEDDFFLMAPGEERVITQSFTLDPMVPGPGTATARLTGFAAGTSIRVRWTYQNRATSWPGGAQTLDGVTSPLFGGGPIPHIWTGSLSVESSWIVPD